MNTLERLVQMILRGQADKFKTIMQEELQNRASVLLERMYKEESRALLNSLETEIIASSEPKSAVITEHSSFKPQSLYQLKDGGIGILTEQEQEMIGKLHQSLNKDNREKLEKLISESQEAFNRILKLAKTQFKK